MNKKTVVCILTLILLMFLCAPVLAEDSILVSWNLTFETDDVLAAAKEACMVFMGQGFWEEADVQAMGFVVLDQQETEEQVTLSLVAAQSVFDVSSGEPDRIAGERKPVKLTFAKENGVFRLLSFLQPEDGENNASTKRTIFGDAMFKDMIKNDREYAELSKQDSIAEANSYIEFLETGEKHGTWHAFLKNGSEKDAMKIIHEALVPYYPYYPGKVTRYPYDTRLYTLSVEGEQSYSGILTFCCYDAQGNQISYCRVRVTDGELKILDGKLPKKYIY